MTSLEKLTLVGRVQDRVEDLDLCVLAILGGTACEVRQEQKVIVVILDRDANFETLRSARIAYDISYVPIISEDDPKMMNQIRNALS